MFNENKVSKVLSPEKIIESEQYYIDCFNCENTNSLKMIIKLFKGYYLKMALSLVFFFIRSSPEWIIPIFTANIINIAIDKPDDYLKKLTIYFIMSVIIIVQNIPFHMLQMKYLNTSIRNVEAGLRGAMIKKLQQLTISFHKQTESGKIQSKVMRDVESITELSNYFFNTILGVIINMSISLIVIVTRNVLVFFVFILCVPIVVLIKNIFLDKMKKESHSFRVKIEKTASAVYDMEELIPITRAHALENKEIKKLTSDITGIASSGYKLDFIQNFFGCSNWVVFRVFQTLCLFFTVFLALNNKISVGEISLYQSYFAALIGHVTSLIAILPQIAKGTEAINSIGEILRSNEVEQNTKKIKIKDLNGEYEFKNVSFNYDEDTPVLENLSIHVNPHETIALVGESGSGKSTILNLVLGFNKANSGTMLIDGYNIDDLDLHQYRKYISIVPQNSILFSGSIKDNITYGCSDISDDFLNYVIKSAKLDSVIEKLPYGLDTLVGERGAKLSGGQCQRISIARAIIRRPKVIIFDEATSALDSVTEKEIQQAIENLTENTTTFIVAHRLSTIRNADKIAVIKDGNCVEYGSYEELMNKKGEFYQLKVNQS